MKLLSLSMEGFGVYADKVDVDFSGERFVAIVGKNGAGKSTLIDAIRWALWGTTRGQGADSAISRNLDKCEVSVTLSVDGVIYRVTRARKRNNKTRLSLECSGEDGWCTVADTLVVEVQQQIDRLIGLDGDLADTTVFVGQGDANRFSAATPAERKEILGALVGIDAYGAWAAVARDLSRQASAAEAAQDTIKTAAEARVRSHQDAADQLPSLLEQQQIAETALSSAIRDEADLSGKEQDAAVQLAQYPRISQELAQARSSLKLREDDLATASLKAAAVLKDAQHALAALPPIPDEPEGGDIDVTVAQLNAKLREAEVEAAKASAALRSATNAVATAAANRDAAAEHLRHLGGNTNDPMCPTCGQALSEMAAERVFGAARDNLRSAEAKLSQAQAEIADQISRASKLSKLSSTLAAQLEAASLAMDNHKAVASRRAQLIAEHATASARVAAAEAAMVDTVERESRLKLEIKQLQQRIDELTAQVDGETEAKLAYDALTIQAGNARRNRVEAERVARMVAVALNAAQNAAKELQAARNELAEAEVARRRYGTEARVYQVLAEAFGPNGIPALIYAGVVGELEVDAAEELNILSGGRLGLSLETRRQSKTKKGAEIETLEVLIHDSDGAMPYESWSGGERLRVDLALRVGLARLAARRAGRLPIRFLSIDEGFGALDIEGRNAAIECLSKLGGDFDLILAVTHDPDVADAFSTIIDVDGTRVPPLQITRK